MRYGLSEEQLTEIIRLLGNYPEIEEAVLFGSRAIGTYKESSDVDIALKGEKVTASLAAKLKFYFEEETYLPFFFDFIAYSSITNEALKEHIDVKGVSIYRNGWKECKLGDVVEITSSKRIFYSDYVPEGIPFFRSKEIIERALGESSGEPLYISKEKYFEIKEKFGTPQNGDLLISAVGERAGIPYVVKNQGDFYFKDGNLIWFRNINPCLNIEFFYSWIKSNIGQMTLESIMIGSAQKALTIIGLKNLEIPLPPLPEQKAIASVLSSLDDKIDLLHRQNKTLEGMVEVLFRQWFVEEASDDWEEVKLGNYVKMNNLTIKKDFNYETIEYLDTSSITEGKIEEFQSLNINKAPSRAKRIVKHNDIVFSTVRPNQKHYGIIKNPVNNLIVSTGFCVLTCDKISPYFVYILLTTDEMTEYLHSIAEGSTSTYPSLKPSDIAKIEFQLPPKEKLKSFSDYAESVWGKIENNSNQIQTLEKMRDNLLPKLMSGEIRLNLD